MANDDAFRYRLWATVESLRYWAPTIADVARIEEKESTASWTISITPRVESGCPVLLTLKASQLFDIAIAGEAYADRAADALDFVLPLIESIAEGRVIQRRLVSASTGAVRAIETLVTLPDGTMWRDGRTLVPAAGAAVDEATERHDRHFLPYRR